MVRVQSQVFHWVLWTVFFCTEGFAVRAQTTSTIQFVNRLGGAGRCVAVKDHYAYLDHGRRLGIYDIADPSRPVKTGEITLERNGYPRHGFKSMTIDGSRAYILLEAPNEQNSPICDLYDLTNLAAPAFVRNLNSVYFRLFSQASNLYWDRLDSAGDDLYCSNKNGLWILNQSNPARTDVLGGYTPEGTVRCDMAATSRTAFLLRNGSIFETVDVSTPTLPKCMARLDLAITSTSATRMHLAGGLALVMDEQRLQVIDVSTPTSPTLLSTLPLPYSAERAGTARWDFTTSGTTAFLFGDFSLNAIDFSDPRAPRLMPEYPFPVAGLDLQGGLAVCREGGLLVMRDLASPSAAVPLGRAGLDLLGVRQIEAADGTLYCIDDAGLKVLTPAGLSNGELTAKLEGASGPMTLGGSSLYLNGPDFRILDVADPRAPAWWAGPPCPGRFRIGAAWMEHVFTRRPEPSV